MKKNYLFVLFLLSVIISHGQSKWKTIKLDERMSVDFPMIPEKKAGNGTVGYTLKTPDSLIYTAVIADMKVVGNLDSAAIAPLKDTREFANQIKAGMASQRKNYTFGDIVIGKWKNYTAYNMEGKKSTNKSNVAIKIILIGSKMYAFSLVFPDGLSITDRNVFFDSISLIHSGK